MTTSLSDFCKDLAAGSWQRQENFWSGGVPNLPVNPPAVTGARIDGDVLHLYVAGVDTKLPGAACEEIVEMVDGSDVVIGYALYRQKVISQQRKKIDGGGTVEVPIPGSRKRFVCNVFKTDLLAAYAAEYKAARDLQLSEDEREEQERLAALFSPLVAKLVGKTITGISPGKYGGMTVELDHSETIDVTARMIDHEDCSLFVGDLDIK